MLNGEPDGPVFVPMLRRETTDRCRYATIGTSRCRERTFVKGSIAILMTDAERHKSAKPGKPGTAKKTDPDWATGLKRLYDSVVDEPLPDAFKDLIAKLDSGQK